MIRLLQLEAPNRGRQGDHIYRTLQPCRALGMLEGLEVYSGSLLAPDLHERARSAEVLVLCDVVDVDLLRVVETRRREGRFTLYEVNDHFLAPQAWNPTAYLAQNLLTRSLSSQLARACHGVQFTVPELEKDFGHLNARRAVFPNQLWSLPPYRPPTPRAPLRLGWGGSLGHQEDLRWIMPALQHTLGRHPEVMLCVMGPERLRPLFDWAPARQLEFRPGGAIDDYYQFLSTLDIGLCPNLPTAFNRCRSDVKFLEYAGHSVLALCSDIAPYRASVEPHQNGFLFATPQELQQQLEQLVLDLPLRQRVTERAYEQFAAQRLEQPHAAARWETYRRWAEELGHPLTSSRPPSEMSERYTFPGSRYVRVDGGEVEQRLYEGLAHARDGQLAQALGCFEEAGRRAPSFYLPPLLRGSMAPDPQQAVQWLKDAVSLAPDSAHLALTLAQRYEELGQHDHARRELERCRALSPSLGAAQHRLGLLAEKAGDLEAAVALYVEAWEANPFYAPAAVGLGQQALQRRDLDAVVSLMERALEADSYLWHYHFLLGRALHQRGELSRARQSLERALESSDEPLPVMAQLAKVLVGQKEVAEAQALLARMKQIGAKVG